MKFQNIHDLQRVCTEILNDEKAGIYSYPMVHNGFVFSVAHIENSTNTSVIVVLHHSNGEEQALRQSTRGRTTAKAKQLAEELIAK